MEKILKEVKGTLLFDVFSIMKDGNFSELPKEPVGDDEKVIGSLVPLEKGLYTYLEQCSEKMKKLIKTLMCDTGTGGSFKKMKTELEALRDDISVARKMLWNCIESRTGVRDGNKSIRAEGKVVVLSEDDDNDCNYPSCQLKKEIMGRGGSGMAIISISRSTFPFFNM